MNETPATQLNNPQEVEIALPDIAPKVTYVILGFTVFIYLMQLLSAAVFGYAFYDIDWLEIFGARINESIRAGEVWRFITPVFLHGSPQHIFFNMYALFSIGSFVERQYGHRRFFILYFLAAFSGNVLSFLFGSEQGLSVGASTAVFGIIAAEAVFFYQNRKLFGAQARQALGNTAFIIILNLVIGASSNGIDNGGHVGGLLGGAIFAWFAGAYWQVIGVPPLLHLEDQRAQGDTILGAGVVMIIFTALAIWGMFF